MQTYIALLRGINVGGKNILRMKELRQSLLEIGLLNVRTYIQSGNVAFESQPASEELLIRQIRAAIQDRHALSLSVLVLTQESFKDALKNNPYASWSVEPKNIHLYFLASAPATAALENARALATNTENCAIVGKVFYLCTPEGVARSKLAAGAETALGVSTTARNLRSASKILELAII